jgi:hypothetical protein
MLIVAVAWIYVVGLMALTESTVVAGIMTFLLYCVLPVSILYYLTGSRRRAAQRARREHVERAARQAAAVGESATIVPEAAELRAGTISSPDASAGQARAAAED